MAKLKRVEQPTSDEEIMLYHVILPVNEEILTEVQERFFSLGVGWLSTGKRVEPIDASEDDTYKLCVAYISGDRCQMHDLENPTWVLCSSRKPAMKEVEYTEVFEDGFDPSKILEEEEEADTELVVSPNPDIDVPLFVQEELLGKTMAVLDKMQEVGIKWNDLKRILPYNPLPTSDGGILYCTKPSNLYKPEYYTKTTVGRFLKRRLDISYVAYSGISDKLKYMSLMEELEVCEVFGEEIPNMYVQLGKKYGGMLGGGCMRYYPYMTEFYARNPDKVSLLVIDSKKNNIGMKALLWTSLEYMDSTDNSWKTLEIPLLDRVYTQGDGRDVGRDAVMDYCKSTYPDGFLYRKPGCSTLYFKGEPWTGTLIRTTMNNAPYVPYIDTLYYGERAEDRKSPTITLYNKSTEGDCRYYQSTNGYWEQYVQFTCPICGEDHEVLKELKGNNSVFYKGQKVLMCATCTDSLCTECDTCGKKVLIEDSGRYVYTAGGRKRCLCPACIRKELQRGRLRRCIKCDAWFFTGNDNCLCHVCKKSSDEESLDTLIASLYTSITLK